MLKLSAGLFILFLVGCASHTGVAPGQSGDSTDTDFRTEEMKRIAHEFFIRGRYQDLKGNPEIALDFYSIAFQYDSLSRELCYFLCERHKDQGDFAKALNYAVRGMSLPGEARFKEHKLTGDVYLHTNNLDAALAFYEKAYSKDSNDEELLYTLATIYEQKGDAEAQIRVLSKLLPAIQYPERLLDRLAVLYRMKGRFQELTELYRKAWKETEFNLFGEKLAGVYENLEMYAHSLEVYRSLYESDTGNMYYKAQLARSYILMDLVDSAYFYYGELAAAFPEKEEFVFTYATLLFEKGEYPEAKSLFMKLLEKQPDHSTYHYYLGSVGEVLEDSDLAELEYHKAVQLNENILEYWVKLALFLLKEGRDGEAMSLFSRAVELHKDSPFAWYINGVLFNRAAEVSSRTLKESGRKDSSGIRAVTDLRKQAVAHFRKSVELKGDDTRVLFELGALLERIGLAEEAVETFKKLIQLDSTNAGALNYLGYMYVEKNQEMETALRLIDKALKYEPENGAYLDSKGWWFFKMGQYEKAKEYIELSLKTGMEDVTIIEHLALILEKLGDWESAREKWTQILKLDPEHAVAKERVN